jgi:ABC-type sugar transport systems, permease components
MRLALPAVRLSVGAVVVAVWVLPEITAALVWYAFTQAHGTLAIIAGQPEMNFLFAAPLLIVSLANLWRNVAFSMLVYSAGYETCRQRWRGGSARGRVSDPTAVLNYPAASPADDRHEPAACHAA